MNETTSKGSAGGTLASSRLTEAVVSFALDTPGAGLPPVVLERGKALILDTIGVALAASSRPIGKIITEFATAEGGTPASATILGAGRKVPPAQAALANGTLANALDYDCGFHHPTYILPTALALVEQGRLSGRELLDAVVIGQELGSRLQESMDGGREAGQGPTSRGWWHIKLSGPIAAALIAARLLKFDARRAAMAAGIASCSSGGFRRNFGTMAKALHSGQAARDGIQAAFLADRGFTADPCILESPLGFYSAVCLPDEVDPKALTERLGKPHGLEDSHRLKNYPACSPAHPLIDVALAIHNQPGFASDQIESIDADLHYFSLLRPEAVDDESAGFSGAFILSATLVYGTFGLEQYTDAVLHDPRVRRLMGCIRHVKSDKRGVEKMTVRLRGGKELKAEVAGRTRRLEDPAAISRKFLDCAALAIPRKAAEEVQDIVKNLDQQPDVNRLMALAGG